MEETCSRIRPSLNFLSLLPLNELNWIIYHNICYTTIFMRMQWKYNKFDYMSFSFHRSLSFVRYKHFSNLLSLYYINIYISTLYFVQVFCVLNFLYPILLCRVSEILMGYPWASVIIFDFLQFLPIPSPHKWARRIIQSPPQQWCLHIPPILQKLDNYLWRSSIISIELCSTLA